MSLRNIAEKVMPDFLFKALCRSRCRTVYRKRLKMTPEELEMEARRCFRSRCGRELEPENLRTFNEKLQYLACYDVTELKTICADKYRIREYAIPLIGEKYFPELYGVYDSFDEIDFDVLPERFALKANHGSGYNCIVADKNKLDRKKAKADFDRWMKVKFGLLFLELQYCNITPRIIAEEFIGSPGRDLVDYKVHCFNGKPLFVQVMGDRQTAEIHEKFYDTDWNVQPFIFNYYPYQHTHERPEALPEMLDIAAKLSHDFSYVRVDLYLLDDGTIRLGELTFTPAGGADMWKPPEYDEIIGAMLTVPEEKYPLSKQKMAKFDAAASGNNEGR